jgi:hypothetical protein
MRKVQQEEEKRSSGPGWLVAKWWSLTRRDTPAKKCRGRQLCRGYERPCMSATAAEFDVYTIPPYFSWEFGGLVENKKRTNQKIETQRKVEIGNPPTPQK